ncbi:MAG: hypothetical protein WDZ88_02625 [Candidatus Paceibacterota bacterium]
MKALTPLLLIILSLAVVWLYLAPMYQEVRFEQVVHDVYEQYNKDAEDLIDKEMELREQLTSISVEDRARLQTLLPESRTSVELSLRLQQIAQRVNLTLLEITSVEEDAVDPRTQRGGAEDVVEKPYAVLSSSMTLLATYQQFLSFMELAESSLYFFDVRSIAIETETEETVPSNVYTYTVEFDSYVLKQ